jgi:hypothetical protein
MLEMIKTLTYISYTRLMILSINDSFHGKGPPLHTHKVIKYIPLDHE